MTEGSRKWNANIFLFLKKWYRVLDDTYRQNSAKFSLYLPIWKAVLSDFVNVSSKLKALSQDGKFSKEGKNCYFLSGMETDWSQLFPL